MIITLLHVCKVCMCLYLCMCMLLPVPVPVHVYAPTGDCTCARVYWEHKHQAIYTGCLNWPYTPAV